MGIAAGAAVARAPPLRRTLLGVSIKQWRKLGRHMTTVMAVALALAIFAIMIRVAVNEDSSTKVKGYQREQLSPPAPTPQQVPSAALP